MEVAMLILSLLVGCFASCGEKDGEDSAAEQEEVQQEVEDSAQEVEDSGSDTAEQEDTSEE